MRWQLAAALGDAERRDLEALHAGWDRRQERFSPRVLKSNRLRTVAVVDREALGTQAPETKGSAGGARRWILKVYSYPRLADRLGARLTSGRARREFQALTRLRDMGFPVPRPLSWGEWSRRGLPSGGALVMEEVEDAVELVPELERLGAGGETSDDARRRDADAGCRALLVDVARAVRGLHDRGVLHPDLHGGNFLIARGAASPLRLIDFHSCRFPGRVPGSLRRRGLAKIAHSLAGAVGGDDLAWFIAAYVAEEGGEVDRIREAAARGEPLDDAIDPDRRSMVTRLAAGARRHAARLERVRVRSRTKRCLRDTTSFAVSRQAGHRVYRLRRFDVDDALALARPVPGGEVLKVSSRGWVVRATVGEREVVVKHRRYSAVQRLAGLFSRHPLRRAWVAGHGLRVRSLPAPLGLALVERRRFGVVTAAWLIQEAVRPGVPLDRYLIDTFEERVAVRGELARLKFSLAVEAGRLLRELHDAGIAIHDASPQNLLIADGDTVAGAEDDEHEIAMHRASLAGRRLWLVDLDDVRATRSLSRRRRLRNLVQAANMPEGHVSTADRMRALRAYDRGERVAMTRETVAALRGDLLEEAMRTIERMTRAELLDNGGTA